MLPPSDLSSFCLLALDGEVLFAFAFVGGLAALLGAIVFLYWRQEKQRTEAFRQVAQEVGLGFFERGDSTLQGRLSHFHLFKQGRSRKITNMLHGEANHVEIAIFDYRFTIGSGKNSHTSRQSVVYCRSQAFRLPHFALRPEGFFHKIGSIFGFKDIDFVTHPKFSGQYLLQGDDESRIRELFDDELLSFLERERDICVEGGDDQLVYYRQGERIKPEDVRRFMQEGFRVVSSFRRSQNG